MENTMTEQLENAKEYLGVVENLDNISLSLTQSTKIGELMKALCRASLKFGRIEKDKTNPMFSSRYASLDAIIPSIKPSLLEEGLFLNSYFQPDHYDASSTYFITRLFHADSEQYIASIIKLTIDLEPKTSLSKDGKEKKSNPLQELGIHITYLRRYSIGALLNLATDEDNDGNNAEQSRSSNTSSASFYPAKPKPTATNTFQSANTSDQARVTAFSKLKKIREELGIEPEQNKTIVNNLGYTAMKDIPMDKMDTLEKMYRDYVASRDI